MPDRHNPFKDIEELFERMGRGFDPGQLGVQSIAVDVAETDENVVVTADLPGYEKSDIEVSVQDGRLTLRAERDEAREEEDEATRYHRRERTHREVTRSVYLPEDVEEEQASASYTNGVLTVTLPKQTTSDEGFSIDVS